MMDSIVAELQADLVNNRRVLPKTLPRLYKGINRCKSLVLEQLDTEHRLTQTIDMKDYTISKSYQDRKENSGRDLEKEVKEQMKMLTIIHKKKDCPISRIIDAI